MLKVLFLVLILSPVCLAQDFSAAKQTIDIFLHSWLVEKNIELAESHFADGLFTNKHFFADGVFFDEFKEKKSANLQKAKRKAIKSLQKFTDRIQGNTLKEILTADEMVYEEGELLSSPKNDLYTFYRMDEFDDIQNKENIFTYIKSKFPSKDYLMLVVRVKYKENKTEIIDVPVYAIWAKENSSWKVVQFGVVQE